MRVQWENSKVHWAKYFVARRIPDNFLTACGLAVSPKWETDKDVTCGVCLSQDNQFLWWVIS